MLLAVSNKLLTTGETIDFRCMANTATVLVRTKPLCFISVGAVVNSVAMLSDVKKLLYKLSKQTVSNDGLGSSVPRYSLTKLTL